MPVAVRLFLVVCLLAGQTPVCKVEAARSLARKSVAVAEARATPTCKKGCCAGHSKKSDRPTRDYGTPPTPSCPPDCLSPLCSPVPMAVGQPAVAAYHDGAAPERLPHELCPFPGDVYRTPLDRPPRV